MQNCIKNLLTLSSRKLCTVQVFALSWSFVIAVRPIWRAHEHVFRSDLVLWPARISPCTHQQQKWTGCCTFLFWLFARQEWWSYLLSHCSSPVIFSFDSSNLKAFQWTTATLAQLFCAQIGLRCDWTFLPVECNGFLSQLNYTENLLNLLKNLLN